MTYSFKDLVLKIDGDKEIYCNSVSIDYSTSLEGVEVVGKKESNEYVTTGPPRGSVSLNYYLTGEDFLFDDVRVEGVPRELDFAGLTLNSGYLMSYSFSLDGDGPVNVSTKFDFFEKVRGTFETGQSQLPEADFLTISNVQLSDGNYISSDEVESLSYGYSVALSPKVPIREDASFEEIPLDGVVSAPKKFDISFKCRKYDLDLPIDGVAETLRVNLANRHDTVQTYYDINGIIHTKKMGVSAGGELTHELSIAQGNIGGDVPQLYLVPGDIGGAFTTPTNWPNLLVAAPGDSAFIYGPDHGQSFEAVDNVSFLGYPCKILGKGRTAHELAVDTYAYVEVSLPYNTPEGAKAPLLVRTPAGQSYTRSVLSIVGDGTLDLF